MRWIEGKCRNEPQWKCRCRHLVARWRWSLLVTQNVQQYQIDIDHCGINELTALLPSRNSSASNQASLTLGSFLGPLQSNGGISTESDVSKWTDVGLHLRASHLFAIFTFQFQAVFFSIRWFLLLLRSPVGQATVSSATVLVASVGTSVDGGSLAKTHHFWEDRRSSKEDKRRSQGRCRDDRGRSRYMALTWDGV